MANDPTATYRKLYALLLHLYPRPFRERFAEGMEQTFHDLCRERTLAGKGLLTLALWIYTETFIAILGESIMNHKSIQRAALLAVSILLIPLSGNLFFGWHWPPFAFVIWGMLLFGTGLAYQFIAARLDRVSYRLAVGIACATGFILFWMNAAVGIIGEGPINLLYLAVLACPIAGALLARFNPQPMGLALFATATVQMLVPTIALVVWKLAGPSLLTVPESPNPPFQPGIGPVFALNAAFAAMWIISGLLFWKASRTSPHALPELIPAV